MFTSPTLGPATYSDTVDAFGTARLRIGYAPGNWLFYATGGLAWIEDRQLLRVVATGAAESPNQWRSGWTAGAGVEIPFIPHWTARLEYLYTHYGTSTQSFGSGTQRIASYLYLQEVRLGLNYQFGGDPFAAAQSPTAPAPPTWINPANVSIHGQTTVLAQGYPAFRSPYEGAQSLPGGGQIRETWDLTLLFGVRLWPGGELWFNPEIDQGFGLDNAHGVAGFTSATAYKLGFASPYGRVQRLFFRQTIDLGGKAEEVNSDFNQFAGSRTANHLTLTVGRLYVIDNFDTNEYANDPRSDFLNWGPSIIIRSTMPATPGAPPTARSPNCTRVPGRCASGCTTCRQPRLVGVIALPHMCQERQVKKSEVAGVQETQISTAGNNYLRRIQCWPTRILD